MAVCPAWAQVALFTLTICMATAACVLGDMAINVELAYAKASGACRTQRAGFPCLWDILEIRVAQAAREG